MKDKKRPENGGGYPPFSVAHRALYGTIHKNIPGHDVWAPGAGAPSPHRKARQSSAGLTRKSTAELRRSLGACICAGSNLLPATFLVADAIDLPTESGRNTERIPKLGLQAAVDAQCPVVAEFPHPALRKAPG